MADEALNVVCFGAGGHAFAVEASQITAMQDMRPEQSLSAEALLGLPASPEGSRRWLRVGERFVEVGEPVALRELPVDGIYPLPPFVAARLQLTGVRALALADKSILLVDLLQLTTT